MTCIAGVAQDGRVWIGGDSAGVTAGQLLVRADEKVFRKGEFLFGFTTSFRMGDLLRFAFKPPEQTSRQKDREFLSTSFIDAVRQCLKTGGWATVENGHERGGAFLLGYRGALYRVDSDFQVGQAADGYDAVGAGAEVANGALFASTGDPRRRVRRALEAAERHCTGVRGPFKVLST